VPRATHTLSWQRVAAAVTGVVAVVAALWSYPPFSSWALRASRAALGIEQPAQGDPNRGLDPHLWEQTLQYWEPFQYDAREAPRVGVLGVSSYVPRDNLADIEGRVSGRRPNRTDVMDGLHALDTVLLRYPERFTRATGFERVVWLCDMIKDGAPVRGFALPPARVLVMDPTAFDLNIFHHEMFHMVDYALHGYPGDQSAWEALNPPSARYIGHAAYAEELRRGGGTGHADPCFITDYARVSPAEDRAETFRVCMSDARLCAERRASSSVIDAKARYVIAAVDALAEGSSVALGLR
jgi:hypothetical protein